MTDAEIKKFYSGLSQYYKTQLDKAKFELNQREDLLLSVLDKVVEIHNHASDTNFADSPVVVLSNAIIEEYKTLLKWWESMQ